MNHQDTIAAQATALGKGGIGIIRISGPQVKAIATVVLGEIPSPRQANYYPFLDANNAAIDEGIALFFPAPNSFTGEDVLELQGHGGPVILDALLRRIIHCGARIANPGEFSQRAFLNDKIDLSQAEAIADLIDASSEQAARSAIRSLQGEFSKYIYQLLEALINLRLYVEAAIDFPEEEVDFLSDGKIATQLEQILVELKQIKTNAKQGALLRDGITIVIVGKPNAGKSSLLNCLSNREVAIVTEIPGTTRDILREQIQIDGLPLHIIDTAGLRESSDRVEQEGIRRALAEIAKADQVLFVADATQTENQDPKEIWAELTGKIPFPEKITLIRNKVDLIQETVQLQNTNNYVTISLSAKTGDGINLLRQHLKSSVGFAANTEGTFIARRRHLEALEKTQQHLLLGKKQLEDYRAGELLAEELRQAQQALGEITGEFRSDDLLGRIFSSFCIGK